MGTLRDFTVCLPEDDLPLEIENETFALVLENALALIKPPPAHRAECEALITEAVCVVWRIKEHHRHIASSKAVRQWRRVAGALRVLEDAYAAGLLNYWPAELSLPDGGFPQGIIRKCYKYYKAQGAMRAPKAGKPKSLARTMAVYEAHRLLVEFGCTPTKTRGAAWHALAEVLYADATADLYQALTDYEVGRLSTVPLSRLAVAIQD